MAARGDGNSDSSRLGAFVQAARLERGLSQAQLAERCALAQTQISYIELGQRRPSLDQLLAIAKALDVSIARFISGSDQPGTNLREIAVELRNLGIQDLWVKDAVVPGAFRCPEQVVALALAPQEPNARVVEAIPAVLAWNALSPLLLRAFALSHGVRTLRRLAWLADVVLTIERLRGFPGGAHTEPLSTLISHAPAPDGRQSRWDSLGRPGTSSPSLPVSKRWRISYGASLEEFEDRAKALLAFRTPPAARPHRVRRRTQ